MNVRFLAEMRSPAPALTRGLALLFLLRESGALSLEEMARRLSLPRASLFRLVATLQQAGLVHKNEAKEYEALWTLQPKGDRGEQLRGRLRGSIDALAREVGFSVEWYEPDGEGMRLVLQEHPESGIRVQVRPGYLRGWKEEAEAVTLLGLAFGPGALLPTSIAAYSSNGVRGKISRRTLQDWVAAAKRSGNASDAAYNSNGVRRHAMACRREGVFLGVMAIAEVYHFKPPYRPADLLKRLKHLLESIL